MRDNPAHNTAVLGGMFGTRVNATLIASSHLKILRAMLKKSKGKSKGWDQSLLRKHFWPVAELDLVAHDSYTRQNYPNIGNRPFPTKRETSEDFKTGVKDNFVGSNGGWVILQGSAKPCPAECRPRDHQDWLLC